MKRPLILAVALASLGGWTPPAGAQSVVSRTPNLAGGWTAAPGVIQLNFLHRFSLSDAPLRKVTNTPTFNLGTGLTDRVMVGAVYGSNSALVPAYPNEWEFYARALPVSQDRGAPLDVAVQGGYNVASESVDGEVLLARSLGRVKVLAAGRAFSEAYDSTAARFAVTGGLSLGLTSSVSLAGDYGVLLDRQDGEDAAWGVGLQIGVPYTPHSFSIHATNVGTASLEGASRGTRTRWGFEYTIPITVRRYLPARSRSSDDGMMSGEMASMDHEMDMDMEPMDTMASDTMAMEMEMEMDMENMSMADTVVVDIKNLAYAMDRIEIDAGTTVVWRNMDPVQHSITADGMDGMGGMGFDSGLIEPGMSWAMTFSEEGSFPFHCTPHPFMKGTVVVRGMMDAMSGQAEGGDR